MMASAAALSLPAPAWASAGFQPVSKAELELTSEPKAPGAPAIILYRQVDRDDSGATSHEDDYFRIKILTEAGRERANIEIPFDKGSEDVVHIRARTIKPDGTIVNFDGKIFENTIVKGKGIKYLAKTFTLPDVQVGGIIEYYYTTDLSENKIFDSHWILNQDLFTKSARFSLKPYLGETDKPMVLRTVWQGLPHGVEPKEEHDHSVRMEVNDIAAFQTEDFMPPPDELKARVDFIYDEQSTEHDPDKYWKAMNKKWNSDLEHFAGKHQALAKAVAETVSAGDPPEVKLRKLYDRVQQLRNTSFEQEKTEQEQKRAKEKAADNVEDLLRRGYGSARELTWLYLGLVREAGFDATGCWVSSRSEFFFTPKTMQAMKLNTNVVLIKLNGQDRYFDPGVPFTPFGLLEWQETNTPGLCLDKNGGRWVTTTLPASQQSQIARSGTLKLSSEGQLEGKLTIRYTGLQGMYRRLEERHADNVERTKYLEDDLKDQIPLGSEVTLTNQPDWTSAEAPLVAEFEVKIPGWVTGAGHRVFFPVGVFTGLEKGAFQHANRVHPVYFHYPYEEADELNVDLPSGWSVNSVPAGESDDGHIITYFSRAEGNGDRLRLERKLNVDICFLPEKYYPALREFFQAVRNGDEQQVVLQPGATTARN